MKTNTPEIEMKPYGVAVLLNYKERVEYGYKEEEHIPVTIFYKPKPNSSSLWYKRDGEFDVLYDYMIDKKYSLEEGRKLFPEAFL